MSDESDYRYRPVDPQLYRLSQQVRIIGDGMTVPEINALIERHHVIGPGMRPLDLSGPNACDPALLKPQRLRDIEREEAEEAARPLSDQEEAWRRGLSLDELAAERSEREARIAAYRRGEF